MAPNKTRQGRRDRSLGTAVTKAEKFSVESALMREGAPDPGPMIREILFAFRDSAEVRDAVRRHRLSKLDRPSAREALAQMEPAA